MCKCGGMYGGYHIPLLFHRSRFLTARQQVESKKKKKEIENGERGGKKKMAPFYPGVKRGDIRQSPSTLLPARISGLNISTDTFSS